MIVKENGLRYAKLIHVSVDNGMTDNSNKVYIMEELSDGRIKCEYGRVGKNMTTVYKSKHEWDKILREKTSAKKGYTDVTELLAEPVVDETKPTNNKVDNIKDAIVRKLVDELMSFANKSIQRNYKVTQESVSEQQVNAAQEVINAISGLLVLGVDKKHINDMLLKLYTIIPRRMDNVKNHLIGDVNTDADTLELIKKLMGPNVNQMKKVFKVVNKKTQVRFDNHFQKAAVKKRRLYWHGSRNENWFNILQTGLLIRPSGAVHTGSMFGDGIYFADKAQKSIGYTSLRGSYWAHGGDNKAFLALFDVHLGNQKEILHHDSSCYKLSDSVLKKDGYDSVFAKGGADLRNNEYIVYRPEQCTVSHLIEIGN